ncbi:MAG: tyrosine-type recombinase/integrase [Dehalogenimonas sp.]
MGLRELLEGLLDKAARRRLQVRTMTNEELLAQYSAELRLKLVDEQYHQYMRTLNLFFDHCGGLPPTRQLALGFLNKFNDRAPSTKRRYAGMIAGLFTSDAGLAIKDFKIDIPVGKPLPQVVTDEQFYKLIEAMGERRSYRADVPRDKLLVLFLGRTGARREEAAEVLVGDVEFGDNPQVIFHGKGSKDRMVPILPELLTPLSTFVEDKDPKESLFGMTKFTITNKIHEAAKRAGLHLHTHSLRHYCAGWMLRQGYTAREVQEWLGHERLDTTGRYLDLLPEDLHHAVKRTSMMSSDIAGASIDQTIAGLSEFDVLVCGVKINCLAVLKMLWGKFISGMTTGELLTKLIEEYSLGKDDPKALWDATDDLLNELSLHQAIKIEQRRQARTVRGSVDAEYWVLTDHGKAAVLKLRREKINTSQTNTLSNSGGASSFSNTMPLPHSFFQVLEDPAKLAGMADPTHSTLSWASLFDLGFGYVVCLNNEKPKYDPKPLVLLMSVKLEDLCGGGKPTRLVSEKRKYLDVADAITKVLQANVTHPKGVIVHCTGGVGRTGTVIGLVLANLGFNVSEIKNLLHPQGWPEGSKWQEGIVIGRANYSQEHKCH